MTEYDVRISDWRSVVCSSDLSLLEAFVYARREVQREYETTNRLQTEHAMLDDDGDGAGRADPSARGPDGTVANRFFLQSAAGVSAEAASNPRVSSVGRTAGEGSVSTGCACG